MSVKRSKRVAQMARLVPIVELMRIALVRLQGLATALRVPLVRFRVVLNRSLRAAATVVAVPATAINVFAVVIATSLAASAIALSISAIAACTCTALGGC